MEKNKKRALKEVVIYFAVFFFAIFIFFGSGFFIKDPGYFCLYMLTGFPATFALFISWLWIRRKKETSDFKKITIWSLLTFATAYLFSFIYIYARLILMFRNFTGIG